MTRPASPPAPPASPLEPLDGDPGEVAEQLSEEELTDKIALAMSEALWTAKKARRMAEETGFPLWKVKKLAAVASLALRRQLDINELAVSLLARLERTWARAMREGDLRAAVAALRTMGEVAGVGGAKGLRVEEVPQAKDPLAGLPAEYREMVENPDLSAFWMLHGRRPRQEERAELLAGTRHPADPCGRLECPSCSRPRNAAAMPH